MEKSICHPAQASIGLIFVLALLVTVSGCSGYCVSCTSLADLSPDRNTEFTSNCDLEPGDQVQVILEGNKMVKGIIESVSPTEIALNTPSDDPDPLVIPGYQILWVEEKSASPGRTIFGVAVIGGLAAALYVGVSNWSMY